MRTVFTEMKQSEVDIEYFNGIYKEIANLLGADAALKLHKFYRGQQVSFPVNFFTTEYTVKQMLDEYDGHNIKYLATKYGYSEKWTRKIIRENLVRKD